MSASRSTQPPPNCADLSCKDRQINSDQKATSSNAASLGLGDSAPPCVRRAPGYHRSSLWLTAPIFPAKIDRSIQIKKRLHRTLRVWVSEIAHRVARPKPAASDEVAF